MISPWNALLRLPPTISLIMALVAFSVSVTALSNTNCENNHSSCSNKLPQLQSAGSNVVVEWRPRVSRDTPPRDSKTEDFQQDAPKRGETFEDDEDVVEGGSGEPPADVNILVPKPGEKKVEGPGITESRLHDKATPAPPTLLPQSSPMPEESKSEIVEEPPAAATVGKSTTPSPKEAAPEIEVVTHADIKTKKLPDEEVDISKDPKTPPIIITDTKDAPDDDLTYKARSFELQKVTIVAIVCSILLISILVAIAIIVIRRRRRRGSRGQRKKRRSSGGKIPPEDV